MLKDLAQRRALTRLQTVRHEMTFCERVVQAHARGEKVASIVVDIGETVAEVLAREGYPEDQLVIANVLVEPRRRLGNG